MLVYETIRWAILSGRIEPDIGLPISKILSRLYLYFGLKIRPDTDVRTKELTQKQTRIIKIIHNIRMLEGSLYVVLIANLALYVTGMFPIMVLGIHERKETLFSRPKKDKQILINKAKNLIDKLKKMHYQMHEYVTNLIVPQELDWKAIDRLDEVPMSQRLLNDQTERKRQRITVPVNKEDEKFRPDHNKWWHLLRHSETGVKKNMYVVHREMNMPFKWIPSCSGFTVELSAWDWLYELFGLRVRPEKQQVTYKDWINTEANRGLYYRFLKLNGYREKGDMDSFWRLGIGLLRSHAYQVSAYNYVVSNWSRNQPIHKVIRDMTEVKKLVSRLATNVDYRRVYIPKDPNETELRPGIKVRPLGVPTVPWRVYLHMIANLIVWSKVGKEGNQHGFTPGRGTGTAWKALLERLEKSEYIYEFDLVNMFNELDLKYMRKELMEKYNYPKEVADWLQEMSQSIVKIYPYTCNLGGRPEWLIKEKDKAGLEPDLHVLKFNEDTVNRNLMEGDNTTDRLANFLGLYDEEREEFKRIYKKLSEGSLKEDEVRPPLPPRPTEVNEKGGEKPFLPPRPTEEYKTKGVPQGGGTSPTLSSVATAYLTEGKVICPDGKEAEVIMYADDGLAFGSSMSIAEIISKPEAGITVSQEKSGWLKIGGIWQKESFKYLGLRYYPKTWWRPAYIEADTRKGSKLRLKPYDYFLNWLLIRRDQLVKVAHIREKLKVKANSIPTEVLPEEPISGYESSSRSQRIPESLRGWIYQEFYSFLAYPKKLNLVFQGKYRGKFMSWLYLDSRGISPPQDFSLKAESGSWCTTRWAKFQLLYWRYLFPQDRSDFGKLEKKLSDYLRGLDEMMSEDIPWKMKDRISRMYREARKWMDQSIAEDRIKLNIWNCGSFACTDLLRNWPLEKEHNESVKLIRRNLFKKGVLTEGTKNKVRLLMSMNETFDMSWKPLIRYYHPAPKLRKKDKKVRTEYEKIKAKVKTELKSLSPLLSGLFVVPPSKEAIANFWYFLKSMWLQIYIFSVEKVGNLANLTQTSNKKKVQNEGNKKPPKTEGNCNTLNIENYNPLAKVYYYSLVRGGNVKGSFSGMRWFEYLWRYLIWCYLFGISWLYFLSWNTVQQVTRDEGIDLRPYVHSMESVDVSNERWSWIWIILALSGIGVLLFSIYWVFTKSWELGTEMTEPISSDEVVDSLTRIRNLGLTTSQESMLKDIVTVKIVENEILKEDILKLVDSLSSSLRICKMEKEALSTTLSTSDVNQYLEKVTEVSSLTSRVQFLENQITRLSDALRSSEALVTLSNDKITHLQGLLNNPPVASVLDSFTQTMFEQGNFGTDRELVDLCNALISTRPVYTFNSRLGYGHTLDSQMYVNFTDWTEFMAKLSQLANYLA